MRPLAGLAVLCLLGTSCETPYGGTSPTAQILENAYRPTAPNLTQLVPGDGEITAHFQPGQGGTYSIIEYAISCTPVPGDSTMARTKVGPASPITVTGLVNGTPYSCRGQSRSAGGVSEKSGSLTATPAAPTG